MRKRFKRSREPC